VVRITVVVVIMERAVGGGGRPGEHAGWPGLAASARLGCPGVTGIALGWLRAAALLTMVLVDMQVKK
jgi:hypothetical protein